MSTRSRLRPIFVLAGLALLAGVLPFCQSQSLFEPCPLSNSIAEACHAKKGSNTIYTCVVADHPFCNEKICASWEGHEARCTKACQADKDCPSGSTCQSYLNMKFCVRDADRAGSAGASSPADATNSGG